VCLADVAIPYLAPLLIHTIAHQRHKMAKSGKFHRDSLPRTDAYVDLFLLDGGSFIGDLSKVHAGASGKYRMYNWAFHISHQGKHLLWDLGLDEDRCSYTPWVNRYMLDEVSHVGPRRALVQQLAERGVLAEQIGAVLFRSVTINATEETYQ
jgi:hypothetical protein